MLEQLLRMYTATLLQDVRSPIPHLVGPPGVGKSMVAQRLADTVGRRLHVLNVSRLSPLEIEGVQMPVDTDSDAIRLKLLHNPLWTNLQEGDVVLMDEFLRGFPEVYNGLLDTLTSRHIAGFDLPKVFFVAASNSVVSYDPALEDRLLHLPVPDIRSRASRARKDLAALLTREMFLHPTMERSSEMQELITNQIEPMYAILDQFKGRTRKTGNQLEGMSPRKLIGQVKLRQFQCFELKELINASNEVAANRGHYQYIIYSGHHRLRSERMVSTFNQIAENESLPDAVRQNARLNHMLVQTDLAEQAHSAKTASEKEDNNDADDIFVD